MPSVAPYGSWRSPITSDLIVAATVELSQPTLEGGDAYWIESHPVEAGRNALVRRWDGGATDVVSASFDVRTRVHEYGGGAYVVHDGVVYFSNDRDQRLYRLVAAGEPVAITPGAEGKLRYADGVVDAARDRLICVREDHTVEGREAVNTIVAVDYTGDPDGGRVLVSGNDFFSNSRLSPDGTRLAWLAWNHPNMPWDGTELWVADVNTDGSLGQRWLVAGGERESVLQPEWSPDGILHFVSDRTGWWNLYRLQGRGIDALHPIEAELGGPQWAFRSTVYAFVEPTLIACVFRRNGTARLALLDTATRELSELESPYTSNGGISADGDRVLFTGGSPTAFDAVVQLDLRTREFTTLRQSSELTIDPADVSLAQAIEFPTENGLTAHAFFYPPANRNYTGPADERPPLLVMSHGGPTGATTNQLGLLIQYWTSRGIAVIDVNYGGSTGFGRAYRERLNGQWGIVDMDDCVNVARYVAEQGWVDGGRLMIRGESAGGYTTLCALTFRDAFHAGASLFGVSDAELLARDTHKFESRYLNTLIGPYPERRDLYVERSPIHFADRISAPLILLHGLEDPVVPPSQSELMFATVRDNGLPTAYVTFEGERHGFRRSDSIKRALEAELYFYSRVFGFELADEIEPVPIENLDRLPSADGLRSSARELMQ